MITTEHDKINRTKELFEIIKEFSILKGSDYCIDEICYYLSYIYDCDNDLECYISHISDKIKNKLNIIQEDSSKLLDQYIEKLVEGKH